jgi:hypothetical protein
MDLAVAYLAYDSPRAQPLEQIRIAAHFAYGAALLCVPFFCYLRSVLGAHWFWWMVLVGGSFFFLGLLQQFDYYENIIASLLAVKMKPQKSGFKGGAPSDGD